MSKNTNILILSIAVCDFLTATLVLPLWSYVVMYGQLYFNLPMSFYWLRFIFEAFFTIKSVFHLLLIDIDQYFRVLLPITYKIRMNSKHMYLSLAIRWLISLLGSCLVIFNWDQLSAKLGFTPFCIKTCFRKTK